ncbi:hypothetical protein ST37_16685 [Vibrio sp. qd031]|uniref:VTT domain-containing protein n=1 Tax=Vibrio sp. qd031 TaxID=1603038 RepID=UPI000A1127AF|nr:VTT domain-containing protein [Vibrio sp. qd031]ORT48711.1 hypothetical protein ST37_16685 [Vibrio sp. qd031]
MTNKLIKFVWLVIAISAITTTQNIVSNYSLDEMQALVDENFYPLIAAYALLISVRGLLFIPTLPIIIVMASSLPPLMMFGVTLLASCCSCYLVCLAVDHFDMNKRIEKLPQKSVKKAQRWIQRLGVPAIAGWAFFPFVFTELIVYLSRISGMKRKHIVFAAGLGEGLLIAGIIYVTDWFVTFTL